MQSITLIIGVVCLSALGAAWPELALLENADKLVHLAPLRRHKRQHSSCNSQGSGSVFGHADSAGGLTIGVKNTPINNDNHRLDTSAFATRNILHNAPLSVGGEASYLHKPSQSTFEASAVRTEGMGTDLSASGKYNIYQDRTSNVNVEGYVSKHIGGIEGNQPVDYGVMLNVKKDF